MSQKPVADPDFLARMKAWLDRNNWAYWALMIGGLVGMALVLYYLLRKSGNTEKTVRKQ